MFQVVQGLRRWDVTDAILAGVEELPAGGAAEEIGHVTLEGLPLDFEHPVDGEMVVEGEDGDRQVLIERLKKNGEIGCQGGLADPPFFRGNRYEVRIVCHGGNDNIYRRRGQRLV